MSCLPVSRDPKKCSKITDKLGIREQKIPEQKNKDTRNLVFGPPIPGTFETSLVKAQSH